MKSSGDSDGLRGFFGKRPVVTAVAATVVFAGAVWATMRTVSGPSRAARAVYYYDVSAGELFAAAGGQITPISPPGGGEGTGVLANVFTCGSCSDAGSLQVGWLSKHNEKKVEQLRARHGGEWNDKAMMALDMSEDGYLVSSAAGSEWFAAGSVQGRKIIEASGRMCGGGRGPTPCVP